MLWIGGARAPDEDGYRGDIAMDHLTRRDTPDRSKINMHERWEVKYWTRELGVSHAELQKAVDKVGNSAAAVRKELARH